MDTGDIATLRGVYKSLVNFNAQTNYINKVPSSHFFNNKQYYVQINHIMTILTIEGNCRGQPDNCYVIVDGAFVVLRVDDADS